jgi:transposase
MAMDKKSGYPIYFKYVSGNIVDINTLINIYNQLKIYNINVKHAILDARYYSEENFKALVENNIPFLTRICSNKTLFKELSSKYFKNLENTDN